MDVRYRRGGAANCLACTIQCTIQEGWWLLGGVVAVGVAGEVAWLGGWPLQKGITNIVWCMAYTWEAGGGVVYCPIVVQ